jgi:hypothetical protein
MYYRVSRTFLTDSGGRSERQEDRRPFLVQASNAADAAAAFIEDERANLVGDVTELPGDKATATAEAGNRRFVVFIERALEALRPV